MLIQGCTLYYFTFHIIIPGKFFKQFFLFTAEHTIFFSVKEWTNKRQDDNRLRFCSFLVIITTIPFQKKFHGGCCAGDENKKGILDIPLRRKSHLWASTFSLLSHRCRTRHSHHHEKRVIWDETILEWCLYSLSIIFRLSWRHPTEAFLDTPKIKIFKMCHFRAHPCLPLLLRHRVVHFSKQRSVSTPAKKDKTHHASFFFVGNENVSFLMVHDNQSARWMEP